MRVLFSDDFSATSMQQQLSPHGSRRSSLSPSITESWCNVSQETGSSSASACPVPADKQEEVWDTVPYAFVDDTARSPEACKSGSRSHTDILSLQAVDRKQTAPPVLQRVSSWLEKYHSAETIPGEELPPSDPSLGDFLQCRSPYRPKFLTHRPPYPRQTVDSEDGPERLSRHISLTQSASETRRRIGWVAHRLDDTSQTDGPAIRESAIAASPSSEHMQGTDSAVSQDGSVRSNEEHEDGSIVSGSPRPGDAEFLSYAFQGFVAFQPLDFAARAAAMATMRNMSNDEQPLAIASPAVDKSSPQSARQPRDSGVWSYIAGFFDDFTKDVTYIH